MFKRLLEERPLLSFLLSILLFLYFLLLFDREIAVDRIHDEQITSFSPGDEFHHIHAQYLGLTSMGEPLIMDDYGSRLLIEEIRNYPEKAYMILAGQVGKNREIILEEIQIFPEINLKIIASIFAVLLMFIAIVPNIRITSRGLELKIEKSP